MANLTLNGWDFLQQIGLDTIPYGGLSIHSKDEQLKFHFSNTVLKLEENLFQVTVKLNSEIAKHCDPIKVVWKVPAINLKGTWLSNFESDRRVYSEFDAERMLTSRTALEAPVISLYGHDDTNVHTFACSDAINTLSLGAGLREEDGYVHCNVILFKEKIAKFKHYEISFLLDYREIRYENSLNSVADWWAAFSEYKPMRVPSFSKLPMYSTWYSYHQNITTEGLLIECEIASKLGYKAIIIDDGWQTNDDQRNYGYTGDWKAERFDNMKKFVDDIHVLDMKVLLWYSVPFFGKYSKAYKLFEDKILYYSDEFKAAIIDPRYPETREYLTSIYVNAMKDWDLDGFKLDFIDRFIPNEDTELTLENGRDYTSVGTAVDRLLTDIVNALTAINPNVLIEFRQHYIGPVLRKCGNMFRAHDCPNDAATNKRRIVDLRLLSGNTAVHSDMLMWNYNESVEIAALQFLNIIFSVPQLSVKLNEIKEGHMQMIKHYTAYCIENRDVLLDSSLTALMPTENYPLIKANISDKEIIAVYTDMVVDISTKNGNIDIINAKTSTTLVLNILHDLDVKAFVITDCLGNSIQKGKKSIKKGVLTVHIPVSGMLTISI